MKIKTVKLKNFRNFNDFYAEFSSDINIFIGKNGQGKTNIIESFYVLSVCRSFRTHITQQLIKFNEDFSKINASIIANNHDLNLEMILSGQNKKAKVNGTDVNRTSDFVGYLNVVAFTPDDLNLIKGSPSQRRRFIDLELSKISPIYLFNLSKYNRLLKERNKFLKMLKEKGKSDDLYLEVLDEQMAKLQEEMIKKRIFFIEELEKYASIIYSKIANNDEIISLIYKSYVAGNENLYEKILNKYKKNRQRDIKFMTTQDGIHKDDLKILLNGHEAIHYGSQGQLRTIVLSIKIALLELIKKEIGEYPVLLLDDVLSELDEKRKSMLLSLLDERIQTFITTTSLEDIDEGILKKAKIFMIENGELKED